MNFDWLREELAAAVHDSGVGPIQGEMPWVLFGSAVLLLHGLRREIGDVDVFLAPEAWLALQGRGGWECRRPEPVDPPFLECAVDGVAAHVFYAWTRRDPEVDALQCRRAAELVGGWWCTPLQIIRLHKAMSIPKLAGDPRATKHRDDVESIDCWCAADLFPAGHRVWR